MTADGDPQAQAEAVGRAMYARDNAAHALAMTLEEIRPGYARMRMTVRPDMLNGHHLAHGGLIFTLADTTFAYACNSHNHVTVAQGATIEFLAPGKAGDVLTAEGHGQHSSGRTGVYDIKVTNQDGRTIALFRGKSFHLGTHILTPPQTA
ncbi:MAG: hydroxyphenylacetyl-CoA thioesterase PaaI [Bacteroidota bacterium]